MGFKKKFCAGRGPGGPEKLGYRNFFPKNRKNLNYEGQGDANILLRVDSCCIFCEDAF